MFDQYAKPKAISGIPKLSNYYATFKLTELVT